MAMVHNTIIRGLKIYLQAPNMKTATDKTDFLTYITDFEQHKLFRPGMAADDKYLTAARTRSESF